MDPDIVTDPVDIEYLQEEIAGAPCSVLHVPHKLWPASTGRDQWSWSYGLVNGDVPQMSQEQQEVAEWFSFGLTYLPRRLLDLASPEMPFWEFGQIDVGLSRIARQNAITAMPVTGMEVTHVHFSPGPDYLQWAEADYP